METRQESTRNWQKTIWVIVLTVVVLAVVVYWVMKGRVKDNAYFGNLNNYEQVDQ